MQNRLIKHAWDTYKIAPFSSWILGITTGVLISAILALDLLVTGISIVTFAFIIIPIIFSATLQHIVFKTNGQLTLKSSVKSFGLYYRRDFFGSFSVISSFFKGLLVFLIFEMTLSFIVSSIMQMVSSDLLNSVNTLYEMLDEASLTYDDLINVLYINNNALFNYFSLVFFPSFFLAALFFIYNLSRQSIVIYYKMHSQNVNNRFAKMVYGDVVRRNRMKMFKDYMSLNWPLFVLLALGFVGGTLLGFFWKHDFLYMYAFGILGGSILAIFFLPFYFGNQEALYEYYAEEFATGTGYVADFLLRSLQNNIELSIEEKEKLEKSLAKARNPLEDHPDEEKESNDS